MNWTACCITHALAILKLGSSIAICWRHDIFILDVHIGRICYRNHARKNRAAVVEIEYMPEGLLRVICFMRVYKTFDFARWLYYMHNPISFLWCSKCFVKKCCTAVAVAAMNAISYHSSICKSSMHGTQSSIKLGLMKMYTPWRRFRINFITR